MRRERCAGQRSTKAGRDRAHRQLYRRTGCGRRLTARTGSAFSGHRIADDVIALAVRRNLRYRLSYAEVAEWLAERGFHWVVLRWADVGRAASAAGAPGAADEASASPPARPRR